MTPKDQEMLDSVDTNSDEKLTRRSFLLQSACGAASVYGLSSGLLPLSQAKAEEVEPHFFLMLFIEGGFDWTYAVDARFLALKAAGIHNSYLEYEPSLYAGVNGQTTLLAPTAQALRPWLSRMTVLNGVLVSPSFDGHDQNMNVALSASPFGGESFVPMINTLSLTRRPCPIDVLVLQPLAAATVTNGGRSVPLGRTDATKLIESLRRNPLYPLQSRVSEFVKSRYSGIGGGRGAMARGARETFASLPLAHSLSQMMASIQVSQDTGSEILNTCHYLNSMFKGGVARSAQIVLRTNLPGVNAQVDSHDNSSARKYPLIAENLMSQVAEFLTGLTNTQYDSTRSLMDVTTVMVTSEFTRSLKSPFGTFDQTGTDHNGLSNSILLAGKGIRPGMVVGASDFQTATEVLSGAHVGVGGLDVQKYRSMARPMDFSSLTVRSDLPSGFVQEDYLNVTHVTNTLLKLFGVPENRHRPLRANTPIAPIVRGLLA